MLSRTERQLKAAEQEMERHGDEAAAIIDKAAKEDRDRNDAENAEIAEHQKAMKVIRENREELKAQLAVENEIKVAGHAIGPSQESSGEPAQPKRHKSLGEQFVESQGYKRLTELPDGLAGGSWSTGQIDLKGVDMRFKTTLAEGGNYDAATGTPGAGSPLVPMDNRPGVLPILYQQLTVADLLASGTTNSNAVRYVVESTATNAAAVVPEAAAKPESALGLTTVDEAVRKIATFLPVTDEMLEDASQIQSYINSRLTLFVRQQEEAQLLGGAGNNFNFKGLMPRVPANNRFVSSDADTPNAADHIYEAITVARASFLEPDGVVIHPDDWAELRLLKDDNANYIGGSPFSNTGQGEPGESLWGKRVVVTTAITAGRALVGAFGTAAQLFRRGGLTVEASNSHSDFFIKNLTAIRAEERLALAVYRPSAFAIADLGSAS